LAPLLCAGIIGYRALLRASLPEHGRLGLYGFGDSAHLVAQVALVQGATVHALTRGEASQRLALELGAASARGAYDSPPEPLDSAILFAPVGDLVPVAMRALDRGGVLAVAGIHLTDTPPLNYEHELFYEKELRSVTSNTRDDGREFLAFAITHHVRATTHVYPMSRAQQALQDLKAGVFDGAAVLVNDPDTAQ
jgi:propanol-preferring alcohol dehydrogenase